MNQPLVAASALFAPFGRFLRGLHAQPKPGMPTIQPARWQPSVPGAGCPPPSRRARPYSAAVAAVHRRQLPLRVVRVMEAGQASALAGRILISGRMADVCAELDRMVEREDRLRPAA